VENGFVTDIAGGEEATRLLDSITQAEKNAHTMEAAGKLPPNMGAIYAKNARNIGELGIGLNPLAAISGNMLEDEKAFKTCHFAIGANYDEDAPSLIHLDGLVRNPDITAIYPDGSRSEIEKWGELCV
jgi:leucyl aminopeptidase (aminopeptidase T)